MTMRMLITMKVTWRIFLFFWSKSMGVVYYMCDKLQKNPRTIKSPQPPCLNSAKSAKSAASYIRR